jgi:hypothetical protein
VKRKSEHAPLLGGKVPILIHSRKRGFWQENPIVRRTDCAFHYNGNLLKVNAKEDEMTDEVVTTGNLHFTSVRDWQVAGTTSITGIEFPEPGQLRIRKVVKRSNARSTGKYPSWKMGRMLQWESRNELNAFFLLDSDPDVMSFNEQPCKITYDLDGVSRAHYPDILVQGYGRKELWEVKPDSKAEEPEFARRTTLMIKDLPTWGYTYRVVLANDLAAQPRQRNAYFLLGFGWRPVSDGEREFIRRAINQRGSLLWADACRGEFGPKGREILCSLVLRGALAIDMNVPISVSTRFVARKGNF